MKLSNYNLTAGKKNLLTNVNVEFSSENINIILGQNGTGKSTFMKDLYNNSQKNLSIDSNDICIIGSYISLPNYLKVSDILNQVKKTNQLYDELYEDLGINTIPIDTLYNNLSDGQKQKLKVLSMLKPNKKLILLDELTNAVDKKSSVELCNFIAKFNEKQPQITIIYITHNLADLKYLLPANYYLLESFDLVKYESKDEIVNEYSGI